MPKTPTDEQAKAIECQGNTVITARPGSGKTFTISQKIFAESKTLLSYQGIIAISYTRKASEELKTRCERLGTKRNSSFFGTIDSFCLHEIVDPFLSRYNGRKTVLEVTDDSQEEGLHLETGKVPVGLLCEAALEIVNKVGSARRYLRASYTSVYIDEYQDCGPDQHELVMRLGHMGLRIVAVGDLDQAIYGWAGKSSAYLQKLVHDRSFNHFELTSNHRCHPSIVAYSLRLLGKEDIHIGDDAKRVLVAHLKGDESTIADKISQLIPGIKNKYDIPDSREIAVIARSNSTLDRVAESLTVPYKRYESCILDNGFSKWKRVFGKLLQTYYSESRFFGEFLVQYFNEGMQAKKRQECAQLITEFLDIDERFLSQRIRLAERIAELCEPDMWTTEDIQAYRDATANLDLLHASYRQPRRDEISLLTYHKAKGLEFDAVFCLDTYQYVMPPYKYEKMSYDAFSESLSMHYVGITRARKVCYIPIATNRHNSKDVCHKAIPSKFLSRSGLRDLRFNIQW